MPLGNGSNCMQSSKPASGRLVGTSVWFRRWVRSQPSHVLTSTPVDGDESTNPLEASACALLLLVPVHAGVAAQRLLARVGGIPGAGGSHRLEAPGAPGHHQGAGSRAGAPVWREARQAVAGGLSAGCEGRAHAGGPRKRWRAWRTKRARCCAGACMYVLQLDRSSVTLQPQVLYMSRGTCC